MTSTDVLKKVISSLGLRTGLFHLLVHDVSVNWRQRFPTVRSKLRNLDEAFLHEIPIKSYFIKGSEILKDDFNPDSLVDNTTRVVSIASKVYRGNDEYLHLPMMNFHPEKGVSMSDIERIIKKLYGKKPGYILMSGRFWHYWGEWVLTESEWLMFNCQFLMPTIVVSERYIGHSLYRGYNALRLTASKLFKPTLPYVVQRISGHRNK